MISIELESLIKNLGSRKFRLKHRFVKNQTISMDHKHMFIFVQKPYELYDCPTRMALIAIGSEGVKVGVIDPISMDTNSAIHSMLENMREIKVPNEA